MKRFVTTPIFYVNASPHIGHMYSLVLADVAHRFARIRGGASVLSTGTDEHGMKVAQAAQKAGEAPQPFVDRLSGQFRRLADASKADYARFVRTTDADHAAEAARVWRTLAAKGWLYRAKHAGWYCVSDETFYPETELRRVDAETTVEGTDGGSGGSTGQLVSIESGNPVEWYEEENWFFRLSNLRPQLIELFKQNPDFVLPPARHRSLLDELESSDLADLSVSRPASRCSWGIPVPDCEGEAGGSTETASEIALSGAPAGSAQVRNDAGSAATPAPEQQIMYVWFEALINYLTVARSSSNSQTLDEWWPHAAHIVGKDIVRFHAVYWPAFLLAAGLAPPQHVVVHSHWTLDGAKMSKSRQNVVDPFELIARYGADPVRYALTHDGSLSHDSPFSEDRLVERHNVNLVNKWANLVGRISGPKFDVPAALAAWHREIDAGRAVPDAGVLAERCARYADQFEFGRYCQIVNDAGMAANAAFQAAEPWADPAAPESQIAVAAAADTCRIMAILLQPVCPEYADNMLAKLGVAPERRTLEFAVLGADRAYGQLAKGHVLKRF